MMLEVLHPSMDLPNVCIQHVSSSQLHNSCWDGLNTHTKVPCTWCSSETDVQRLNNMLPLSHCIDVCLSQKNTLHLFVGCSQGSSHLNYREIIQNNSNNPSGTQPYAFGSALRRVQIFPTYLTARLVKIEIDLNNNSLYNDEYEWEAIIRCIVQYLPNLRDVLLTTHVAYRSSWLSHKKHQRGDKVRWWTDTGKVLLRLGAFIVLRHSNLEKMWMLPHRLCACCDPSDPRNPFYERKALRLHLSTKGVTQKELTVKADQPAKVS